MAEDSEKRFHAAMDKLFHAPPRNSKSKSTRTADSSSLNGGGMLRGRKRPHEMTKTLSVAGLKSKGGIVEELRNGSGVPVQAPMCRPWDREDLLQRLATFKSMTWFAKPEVVSAINCARRGWVNVDMDTIACKSCGARLLFTTPSSWAQQQVEKAALVFSLKLNKGHKLLCPWVDNACDEKLAQFPPTSLADLVDDYKKRHASLLHLLAIPVISSSAIDCMRNPQLEHFLKSPSTLEQAYKSDNVCAREYLGDESEENFSALYYQAQKLISLCGWEPRLVPYMVDCKDTSDRSTGDTILPDSSVAVSARKPSITLCSSGTSENMDINEDSAASSVQYDHTSIVLDCRLCGASVGLWAFFTTPRPVEFLRFIGFSGPNDENWAAHQMGDTNTAKSDMYHSNRTLTNLTIAGGPPPAEQNFRPKISLPVVGHNLRTRFSSVFESTPIKDLSQGNKENSSTAVMNLIQGTTDEDFSSTGNESAVSGYLQQNPVGSKETEKQVNSQDFGVQTTVHRLSSGSSSLVKDSKQLSSTTAMEFDPIMQHRHFCPWIASSGKSVPGWKQTLSALQRQNEFFHPSPTNQASSSSLIEVDDPVGSVKKLLTRPWAKRTRLTHGSI